jgi:hypothetical protein
MERGARDVLDVSSTVESVQLDDQLQHGSLNLVVTTCTVVESRSTLNASSALPNPSSHTTHERIHFIEKDDTRLFTPRHFLPHASAKSSPATKRADSQTTT